MRSALHASSLGGRRAAPAMDSRRPPGAAQSATRTTATHPGRCGCGGACPRCRTVPSGHEQAQGGTSEVHGVEADRTDDIGDPLAHAREVSSSPGQPLAAATRRFFERRFGGEDFGAVRIHTDAAAADSARALRAAAYTAGNHIVFGRARYDPDSAPGRHLLAHELAHTMQQRGIALSTASTPGRQHDRFEMEADRIASGVLVGVPGRWPVASLQSPRLQLRSDSEVEEWTRVAEGIAAGSLTPLGAIHGKQFDATSCGAAGCGIRFLFEKAYGGTWPMREHSISPAPWRGVYVKIVAKPVGACPACQSLELLQVLRYLRADSSGKLVTGAPNEPERRQLAGSDDSEAKSQGWMVDAGAGATSPFYSQSWYSEPGDETRPAVLWDSPASFPSERNAGKEFETYLVCVNSESRVPLGCVNWGYVIDQSQNVGFQPSPPKVSCGASAKLFDAAARWDAVKNTPIGLDAGHPPPAGGPTRP
jgi:hypothetical protein